MKISLPQDFIIFNVNVYIPVYPLKIHIVFISLSFNSWQTGTFPLMLDTENEGCLLFIVCISRCHRRK